MASYQHDKDQEFHETWLGMCEPIEGLVVSIPALKEADARDYDYRAATQKDFLKFLDENRRLQSPEHFLREHLGFGDRLEQPAKGIELTLPDENTTLRPSFVLRDRALRNTAKTDASNRPTSGKPSVIPAAEAASDVAMLIWELPAHLDFDDKEAETSAWHYAPQKKFERLMRHARVSLGILISPKLVRLVYAPRGEATGHINFPVSVMSEVPGRPVHEACLTLLSSSRILDAAFDRNLLAICGQSRLMQSEVTSDLSKQVFSALEVLLEAFEEADAMKNGALLRHLLEDDTDPFYQGLLTVVLRLVFLLYAEDASLLPSDHPLYQQGYSLFSLLEDLENDAALYPDTMKARFSAWPRLCALFRLVALGGAHGSLRLPARKGQLFDIQLFPFLEGFGNDFAAVPVIQGELRSKTDPPLISDAAVRSILRKLIYLKGQRLSYRNLYVEQIGSVYEGLMGYFSHRVTSPSVRLGQDKYRDWVSIEELLELKNKAARKKWLKEHVNLKGKSVDTALVAFEEGDQEKTFEALKTLRAKASIKAEKDTARLGRIVLRPGEERKRTSSHYTPQSLSGPIVARALEPLLKAFGPEPSSEQILSLKICDPAMGSGAFLVEACRYLGEHLLEAWHREEKTGSLYSAEDDLTTYARRQVAERCLYGVDKNPFAVELSKLSLWLITLQKEKPFTFLDHSLRCGDSLVGCSLEQIMAFDWNAGIQKKQPKKKTKKQKQPSLIPAQLSLFQSEFDRAMLEAIVAREKIAELSQYDTPEANKNMELAMRDADDALSRLRLIGDLLIGAFFDEKKDAARKKERQRRKDLIEHYFADEEAIVAPEELLALANKTRSELRPFHWMIEFPEVFFAGRKDPLTGKSEDEPAFLDGVIGNPPFLGGGKVSSTSGAEYLAWLQQQYIGKGQCDLCAFFFERAGALLGSHGTAGYVATNTISQGDTRAGGLQSLLATGEAEIYRAEDSVAWPGVAAVTISTVNFAKGEARTFVGDKLLDGKLVDVINSRLRPTPERRDPVKLLSNEQMSFKGSMIYGQGFTLTPEERDSLVKQNPKNAERIFPYLGGKEVNTSPTHAFDRYVINFGDMSLEEAEAWPDLLSIVREKVKPERDKNKREVRRKYWWRFGETAPKLYAAIAGSERCLVTARVSKHVMFHFQPVSRVFSEQLYAFPLESDTSFATLQSRIHECWAWLLSSTMRGAGIRYAASDCFETFPFPKPSLKASIPELETIGKELYEKRAAFMVDTDQGLTTTYNKLKASPKKNGTFADDITPEEMPRIEELRQLHIELDRAVLEAYARETSDPSWSNIDIPPFTEPQNDTEKALHQAYEDHILDKLFALNEERAKG